MSNVEKIFYQRPAKNEVIQIKYLLQQANERGGQMHLEDVEVVYADVGKDLKRKIFLRKLSFSVYDAQGKVKDKPVHVVTDTLKKSLTMSKSTSR